MEKKLRRSTRLLETNSNSAPSSEPVKNERKKKGGKKTAPVESVSTQEDEDKDVPKQSSRKGAGTKGKVNKTSSAKSGGTTSRKRRSDDSKPQSAPKTQHKKSKVASTKNSFDSIVEEVEGVLAAQRTEQIAYAKSQEWSYDPRAEIVTSGLSLHDVCLTGLGLEAFDEIVDHIIKQNTYSESDATDDAPPPPLTPLEDYSASVTAEEDVTRALRNLSEAEVAVLGLNRLFQLVPAKYVSELLAVSATAPTTKDEVKEFLKTLDIGKLIEAHPHAPYFSDVTVIHSSDEEDPLDSESSWCEKFNNHMVWLFEQFDAQKCVNLGRIYRALGRPVMELADEEEVLRKDFMNLALSKLAGTVWRKVAASAIKGDKDDGNENGGEDDDDDESWRAAPLRVHIAKLFLFTFPFNYRTYIGTFAYNVRESDYDGTRSGIADYVSSMAEEHFKPAEFIQVDALRDNEEVSAVENIITEAFYIPGMKSDLGNNDDDDDDDA